jgi:hypothetical protein
VPITSLVRFAPTWRTAGIVQKGPELQILVVGQRPVRQIVDPHGDRAEERTRELRGGVRENLLKSPLATAAPSVTAGFKCASLLATRDRREDTGENRERPSRW